MPDPVVTLPPPLVPMVVLFAAIGGLAAALANRGASVFHDGLRPLMVAMRTGEVPRREIATTSFNLGWGFFWAFGVPFSLGFTVPLVYLIFMATDWIGVSFPAEYDRSWYRSRQSVLGVAGAFLGGAVWSAAMAVGVFAIARLLAGLPVNMATPLGDLAFPALQAFFLFPALTVAYQYGVRSGLIALVLGAVAWYVAGAGGAELPGIWAFAVTAIYLLASLVVQVRRNRGEAGDATIAAWEAELSEAEVEGRQDHDEFAGNIRRIWKAAVPIVLLSMLMGAAYNWPVMAKDPISGRLFALGLAVPAALVMLSWGFAFIPMKFTTAVVTGCMATGTFIDMSLAVLMPNPWLAALAVGALRVAEIAALGPTLRLIERAPAIRELADTMRTAIFHVMEIGFLIGGALVAFQFAGLFGVAVVIALWFLNDRANGPVMPMSIGAFGAIAVGLFANLFAVLGVEIGP